MSIYFIQHGLSVAKEENPDRPLSTEGREQTKQISTQLKRMEVSVKTVCHSGKARAEETAEILASQIADGCSSQRDGMGPNDSAKHFVTTLKDNTMYVGHLPHLENMIAYLVAGDERVRVMKFVNSAVVCVAKGDDGFFIEWIIRPNFFPEIC